MRRYAKFDMSYDYLKGIVVDADEINFQTVKQRFSTDSAIEFQTE